MIHSKKLILIGIMLFLAIFIALQYFIQFGSNLNLVKTKFDRLQNWSQDDQSQALIAFQKSCSEILKRDPSLPFSKLTKAGQVRRWQEICLAANKLEKADSITARQFFEQWFEPYAVKNNFSPKGLFTGYYLPTLNGSLKKTKQYSIPIYGLPKDLIKINLASFRPEFKGVHLIGKIKNNDFIPYPDRAAINNGAIDKSAPVLVWSDSLVDVFFAQIQGSAIVKLPKQQQLLIGYASGNGRAYTAIGKVLLENKALTKQDASMQAIRKWLADHPEQTNEILNRNASYVFFRILKNKDPLGAEQVPLTPQRSLAVDLHYIPVGAPIWLDTVIKEKTDSAEKMLPYQRLLIAQDTGGAIKGVVRGDIYWGSGDEAADKAGHMKSPGRYWILLPKSVKK